MNRIARSKKMSAVVVSFPFPFIRSFLIALIVVLQGDHLLGILADSSTQKHGPSTTPEGNINAEEGRWVYNFAEIRSRCKDQAECPLNEVQRLFDKEKSRAAQANDGRKQQKEDRYFDDDIGDARIALDTVVRELQEIFGPSKSKTAELDLQEVRVPGRQANVKNPLQRSLVRKLFTPQDIRLVQWKAENIRGVPSLFNVTEEGTSAASGPWALKFTMKIPEPGYGLEDEKSTTSSRTDEEVSTPASTSSTSSAGSPPATVSSTRWRPVSYRSDYSKQTRVDGKGRPLITEWWKEKVMHYYAGLAWNVEVRVNRNYPFSAPRVVIQNNIEHAFLGGGGREERNAHVLPKVLFTPRAGFVAKGVEASIEPRESASTLVQFVTDDKFTTSKKKSTARSKKSKSKSTSKGANSKNRIKKKPLRSRKMTLVDAFQRASTSSSTGVAEKPMRKVSQRYFLADALEKTLCFFTYIDGELLSLPFMTAERADSLRGRVKEHVTQNWFEKRINLHTYPSVYSRNKDFFGFSHADGTDYVLQESQRLLAETSTLGVESTLPTSSLSTASASGAAPSRSLTISASGAASSSGGSTSKLALLTQPPQTQLFPKKYLHPKFLEFQDALYKLSPSDVAGRKQLINEKFLEQAPDCQNVYAFPLFTDEFCDLLVHEVRGVHASQLKVQRPNSMNNYGVILNDVGLEPLMDSIQELLRPLGEARFGAAGSNWDGHHSFIVQYSPAKDTHLDMHTDDSDVTINISLGIGEFAGSEVRFCGKMGEADHRKNKCVWRNRKGIAIMHLGRHRHGAMDILEGERMNLIIWNRGSSTYRESFEYDFNIHKRESGPPDKVCVSYTHDRDFGRFRKYPLGQEHMRRRKKWCPKPMAEYEGFKPES
ncbi:unnamed protein product [Amoebophrya sp. A25]|nr:unnamed protein product [Amoebophrya sp. A25]|eukprot:GSA25T00000490001.1